MNVEQLRKNVGALVYLRPIPDEAGDGPLRPKDDEWRIDRIEGSFVRLYNIRTLHIADLGNDNIREFRSPHFLLLRCQITLKGDDVHVEPLVEHGSHTKRARAYLTVRHSEVQLHNHENVAGIRAENDGRFTITWDQPFTSSQYDVQITETACTCRIDDVRPEGLTFWITEVADLPKQPTIKILAVEST